VNAVGTSAGAAAPDVPGPETAVPLLRVVRGDPSAEELAALVTVVAARLSAARAAAAAAAVQRPRDAWSDPAARMRGDLRVGPGVWARSGRTR
jgi:hypothetical protein